MLFSQTTWPFGGWGSSLCPRVLAVVCPASRPPTPALLQTLPPPGPRDSPSQFFRGSRGLQSYVPTLAIQSPWWSAPNHSSDFSRTQPCIPTPHVHARGDAVPTTQKAPPALLSTLPCSSLKNNSKCLLLQEDCPDCPPQTVLTVVRMHPGGKHVVFS